MWYPDVKADSCGNTLGNMDCINVYAITEIQKEVDPCDMISLVFLLYDVPDTALQRLVIYERVYKDSTGRSASDLLLQWALHVQNKPTWKHEFLEALVICQLYKIIRKLGFNVLDVKRYFESDNKSYINPMKKLLYRLCENIESENLAKLKYTLRTYNYDTSNYENCELIFLKLICEKFICIQQYNYGGKVTSIEYKVGDLPDIINNFNGLETFAEQLRALESGNKNQYKDPKVVASPSSPKQEIDVKNNIEKEHIVEEDLMESFDLINKLINDVKIDSLTSDKKRQNNDIYDIKDSNKVGVCYIINQECFYPSKNTIQNKLKTKQLDKRIGSTKDKQCLEKTMSSLNFEVISHDNLDHITMMENIKNILLFRVRRDHSIFILCVMSHGTRGHIYAADCVQVKVEAIENLLDCDGAKHLQGMPKVMIIQACQVNDYLQTPELVADASNYYIKKSDILLYSATAPGYEAYRLEKYGSIFIQTLCKVIKENADKAHLEDIFTKVTYFVHKICTKLRRDQLPKKETTLLKNLYLKKF